MQKSEPELVELSEDVKPEPEPRAVSNADFPVAHTPLEATASD